MHNINRNINLCLKSGTLKYDLHFLEMSEDDVKVKSIKHFTNEEFFSFLPGETVLVLAEVEDNTYSSGLAYVILNEQNESITLDSSLVEMN